MRFSSVVKAPSGGRTIGERGGFTLIEIMVVVAIIIVLVGILLAVGSQVVRSAANNSTKNTLTALDNAMSVYLKDHPEPGMVTPCPNSTAWVQALYALPESAKLIDNLRISGTGANRQVLDGYGKPIYYLPANLSMTKSIPSAPIFDSTLNTPGRFVSFGPDGKPDSAALGATGPVSGAGDDIYSAGVSVTP